MKARFLFLFISLSLLSCSNSKNSPEFINKTAGDYLFNSDEIIRVYYEDGKMNIKWRGKKGISPIKVNDSTFYMKELNERLIFVSKPEMHIELAEKTEHKGVHYSFKKLEPNEKVPSEYLKNNQLQKAIDGYLAIQQKDSLDPNIRERYLNSLGYAALRKNEIEKAIQYFTINTILYPKKSNTYDSLGEAYWKKRDTVNARKYYQKALVLNPENKEASRFLKNYKLN